MPVRALRALPREAYVVTVALIHLLARGIWNVRLPLLLDGITDTLTPHVRDPLLRWLGRHHHISQLVFFEYPQTDPGSPPDYRLTCLDGTVHIARRR
jgi:hypothetical protein